jgi:hypothetical protein
MRVDAVRLAVLDVRGAHLIAGPSIDQSQRVHGALPHSSLKLRP